MTRFDLESEPLNAPAIVLGGAFVVVSNTGSVLPFTTLASAIGELQARRGAGQRARLVRDRVVVLDYDEGYHR